MIADAVSDAIFTLNSKGEICYANRAVETVFGYSPHEILGESLGLIFGEEMVERCRRYFITRTRTLDWRGTRFTVRHRSGSARHVEFSLGEVYEGDDLRLAVVVRDRTEQIRAEEELKARELEFRSTLENVQEVIFRTDLEGRWTLLNPAWEEVTGFSVAASMGRSFLDFIPEAGRAARWQRFQEVMKNTLPYLRHEVEYLTASGQARWVEINARQLFDLRGETIGLCGTLRDVHDRRLAREQQEEARRYAESCSTAKNEFLSRVSHELRTPMNAVLGYAQLMQMEELSPEHAESVEEIVRGGRHVLELLEEFGDISRIESGRLKLNLQPVLLHEPVNAALDLIRPQAVEREITIAPAEISTDPVMADPKRLTQALLNLMSNAVKYNRHGGSIRVWSEARPGGRARVLVNDTGAGLDASQIARLFRPFERVGAERSKVSGTGLGLSVTKQLTELMGGTIGVVSEPGVGSTFWLELPGCAPEPEIRGTPAAIVLCIDEHAADVEQLRRIFSSESNFDLRTADRGARGIELACELLPDLILLDPQLPDMTGLKVLTALRNNPVTEAIPVGIVSADADPRTRGALEEAGIEGWIAKPAGDAALLEMAKKLLERCVPV